jgi:mannose-6-phosphate isomerase
MAGAVSLLLTDFPVVRAPQEWLDAAHRAGATAVEQSALEAVTARYPSDVGVAVAAMLQPVMLQPGDAAYVPAGVPHAYLSGLGVEVMNSSDNVLRLGLTSKTVAVQRALACLDDDQSVVVERGPEDGVYDISGAPFTVVMIAGASSTVLDKGPTDSDGPVESTVAGGKYRLILAVEGAAQVTIAAQQFTLGVGDALAVPAVAQDARVQADGTVMVARERS